MPVDLSKNALTLKYFKESLAESINQSGGLELIEQEQQPDNDIDENDIVVPKSEYMDNNETDKMLEDRENSGNVIDEINANDLGLAIPKDKTSPYDNQWIELADDASIGNITFNDYDIIAFRYIDDDEFHIIEAAYEE